TSELHLWRLVDMFSITHNAYGQTRTTVRFVKRIPRQPHVQSPVVGFSRHATSTSKGICLHVVCLEFDNVSTDHNAFLTASINCWFFLLLEPYSLAENTVIISNTSWANSCSKLNSSP